MFFNLLLFGYTHIQLNSQLQLESFVWNDRLQKPKKLFLKDLIAYLHSSITYLINLVCCHFSLQAQVASFAATDDGYLWTPALFWTSKLSCV